MGYLIIAVSYGTYSDPFTTSAYHDKCEVDITDGDECREWICNEKELELHQIDEVLVVAEANGELGVIKYHRDNLSLVEPDFADLDQLDNGLDSKE